MLPISRRFLTISCGVSLLAVCSGMTTIASAGPVADLTAKASSLAPLPVAISLESVPMILDPKLVPADPGEALKETLTGVDTNGNGVRDDVERWIALNHPDCARYRAALAQVALSVQRRMTAGELSVDAANQLAAEEGNATSCFAAESASCASASMKKFIEFSLLQQNTPARANAYMRVFKLLGEKAFVSPAQGSGCSIPSDRLPN